ncbi:hypothetical protein DB32_007475 [Sandaracinus amylolyticus]|uniref:Uncharacterized protein n=1 Tax=Sandaracinus amylolyticus TaxID=927083 RepID=A0A0F6YM62_9BACT|nr:hypothetical protein DB32_007475 [Sandaracinus amylolyticus]
MTWVLASFAVVACTGEIREEPAREDRAQHDASVLASDAATARDAGAPPIDAAPEGVRLAEGVAIDGLALFQGVRVALAADGAAVASRNAPIVARRAAIVRVYVRVDAPRAITAELEVRDGDRVLDVLRDTRTIATTSRDDDPTSVLQLEIAAEHVTETTRFAVRLVDPAGTLAPTGASHDARLPRDGSAIDLRAQDDGAGLELVLVPIRWDGDGSGRLPITDDAWIARVRALLTSLYPLVDVDITVHAPVAWSGGLSFGAINSMLVDLREREGASPRAYYYALARPEETFGEYCSFRCTTGQSFVVDDPEDHDIRVGTGVGFGTEGSAWTLAHELGHIHGRRHAPCGGASSPDLAFPYDEGGVGVWGFDARDASFVDPGEASDFMSYCDPEWISDYTWSALFARTIAVSALSRHHAAHDVLLVRDGDELVLAGRARMRAPRTRDHRAYRYLDAIGRTIARGLAPAIAQSHTDELVLVLPAPPQRASHVRVGDRVLAIR